MNREGEPMTFGVLQLHVESAPSSSASTRDWTYVHYLVIDGPALEMKPYVDVLGLAGKPKRGVVLLDELPDDASADTALGRADLATLTKVAVIGGATLAKIDWDKTAPLTGYVNAEDFARMRRGERVMSLQKSVRATDIIDNEEMVRRIADGTVGWHHQTKVKWLAPQKHRVPSLYDVYAEHVRGHEPSRRIIAVLGRK